jgi:hypothetical protein
MLQHHRRARTVTEMLRYIAINAFDVKLTLLSLFLNTAVSNKYFYMHKNNNIPVLPLNLPATT